MISSTRKQIKPTGWYMVGLILFWSTFIIYIALASVPFNPLSLPQVDKMNVIRVIPEGWGFFTRDPLEPSILVYQKKASGITELVNPPAADVSYSFGLSRGSRRINFELHSILSRIPDSAWENVELPQALLLDTKKQVTIHITLPDPVLKGDYTVVLQKRIPWAWSRRKDLLLMPYKKINIHVII